MGESAKILTNEAIISDTLQRAPDVELSSEEEDRKSTRLNSSHRP